MTLNPNTDQTPADEAPELDLDEVADNSARAGAPTDEPFSPPPFTR